MTLSDGEAAAVSIKSHEKLVASLPLFKGVAPKIRRELLDNAMTQRIAAGAVLFEQGDTPTFQNIILSGSVQLLGHSSQNREVLIDVVRPFNLVMPAAVMVQECYLLQCRAPEMTQLLMIQAASLRAAILKDPILAKRMIFGLAEEVRRMIRQIKNLKLRSTLERVGCYILALSRNNGGRRIVKFPYEKHLIASELGMTRESFSRALSTLQSEGIVVCGDQVEIVDAERLARVSGPDPLIDPDERVSAELIKH
jgi:CRP/FNR family transcriptional activator FtrB